MHRRRVFAGVAVATTLAGCLGGAGAGGSGDEAGATSTPTFVPFEDGAHRTTIPGVQDAEPFVAAFEA